MRALSARAQECTRAHTRMCSCVCARVTACARVRGHTLRALPAKSRARALARKRETDIHTCTLTHTQRLGMTFPLEAALSEVRTNRPQAEPNLGYCV
jgi:hypothetical protein